MRPSITQVKVSESKWLAAPTNNDYREAAQMLRDFGAASVAVPKFDNYRELQKWTRRRIDMLIENELTAS